MIHLPYYLRIYMKRFITFILFVIIALAIMAKRPRWIECLPTPENNTYYYDRSSATATEKNVAYEKALARVIQNRLMQLGGIANFKDASYSAMSGVSNNIEIEAKVGIKRVCEYEEQIEGGYRVFLLCRVTTQAPTEHWQPIDFDAPFRCGSHSSSDVIEVEYPSEWFQILNNDQYSAVIKHEQYEKGISQTEALESLVRLAQREIRNKLGIDEIGLFNSYCEQKTHFNSTARKSGSDGFAIVYISNANLKRYFKDIFDNYIDYATDIIDQVESMTDDGKYEYQNLIQDAKFQLNHAEVYAQKLAILENGDKSYSTKVNRLRKSIEKYAKDQSNIDIKIRIDKIHSFLNVAQKALEAKKIDQALKYYYWSNILLNELPNPDYVHFDDLHNSEPVSVWLPITIQHILDKLEVMYAGETEENIILLHFTYNGQSVESIQYKYFDLAGESSLHTAKNGTGTVEWEDKTFPNSLRVDIEYMFTNDNTDSEMSDILSKRKILEYGKNAIKEVKIKQTDLNYLSTVNLNLPMSVQITNTDRGIVSKINEGKYENGMQELEQDVINIYHTRLMNVCDAIQKKTPTRVRELFTDEGYNLFQKLIQRGRVNILDKNNITYSLLDKNVVARSIKMSFNFDSSKKQFIENIVFEFDRHRKICNVRYMAEEGIIQNIIKYKASDQQKLALMDFIENYRTSFALKDTNYLYATFSDNAVIITGRVVKQASNKDVNIRIPNEYITYTRHTKQSYLKNLNRIFNNNQFVNVDFPSLDISYAPVDFGENVYGIKLKQDWSSSTYGDSGYLYLLVDFNDYENPIIYVRTWQPKPDFENIKTQDGLFNDDCFSTY